MLLHNQESTKVRCCM